MATPESKGPHLLTFAAEIIEEILSHLENHQDLLRFAAGSSFCARLAIPRHTEYRILVLPEPTPHIWKHLTRLPGLTHNIREVHLGASPGIYPTTLFNEELDGNPATNVADKDQLGQDICSALELMEDLTVFTWRWSLESMVKPEHRASVMNVLSKKKTLKHIWLLWKTISNLDSSAPPVDISTNPTWNISPLTSVTIEGVAWQDDHKTPYIYRWLQNLPALEYLRIGITPLSHLEDYRRLTIPTLQTLSLFGRGNQQIKPFIDRHVSIQEFRWTTRRHAFLSPGCLPNVKRVLASEDVLRAFESAYQLSIPFSPQAGVDSSTSPSGDSTGLASFSSSPIDNRYRLEAIQFASEFHIPLDNLLSFNFIHPSYLKTLWLAGTETVDTLFALANKFHAVTAIYLADLLDDSNSHTFTEWLDFFSHFHQLEALGGNHLRKVAQAESITFQDAVTRLARSCPNLKFLNDCDPMETSDRFVIRRHEITQESSGSESEGSRPHVRIELFREERRFSMTRYLEPLGGHFNNDDQAYVPRLPSSVSAGSEESQSSAR
ncbi:hypothetical protein BDN72DRAFT_824967 [Pluteus cervinus]|uniref:Uncharacterized protein n=1 Tax=Pluteus cervinus TaxID=181527 RepID=A0ACD3AHI8_9AGAR|nr:hypothetical protein BDN72DRAFT_824967 [Pluteus cervinus]